MAAPIPNPSPSEETVWIENPHGIKIAVPESIGQWRVQNFPNYKYCEPEYVPEFKQYPHDDYLTEAGEKRRDKLRKSTEAREAAKGAKTAPKEEAVETEPTLDKAELEAKAARGETLTPEEYRIIGWMPLRAYAKGRGIEKLTGLKRPELLEALDKSHQ